MTSSKMLPVFLFPEELKIAKSTGKQILTLYNPYDVSLNFKILSTTPHLYKVVESEGVMKPHCCIDVVVSRLSLEKQQHHVHGRSGTPGEDKFRVEFYQGTKLVGHKQVSVKLVDEDISRDDQGLNSSVPSNSAGKENANKVMTSNNRTTNASNSPNNMWIALIGLLSLGILLLPMANESSSWPTWLHVTVGMKLLAAFVLGLVTMVILKY